MEEELNSISATPVVQGGVIVRLEKWDEVTEARVPFTLEDYENFGLDPDNLGHLEPHPEGSDRGGYRPELVGTFGVQYDENGGEWQ